MYFTEFSNEAMADYENAVEWYENQRKGLGFDFSVRIADCIAAIEENPTGQRFLYEDRRYAFLKQFPYKIYFVVDEPAQKILVFAILHEKRDPQIWQQRSDVFL
jgi:toxin ParE1/3/4